MDAATTVGWVDVWRCIDERKNELGLGWRDLEERGGMSASAYRNVRRGTPIALASNRTRTCLALGWTTDSIDRILAGRKPVITKPPTDQEKLRQLEERLAAQAELIDQLSAVVARLERLANPSPDPDT